MIVRPYLRVAAATVAFTLGAVACDATAQAVAPQRYSAIALYNQGNADARAGRPALAVLNYARARLLAPRDGDIRANLRAVQRSAGLPARTEPWFVTHARFASPNSVYWIGFVGLMLLGGGIVARKASIRHRQAASVSAFGLVMFLMSAGDTVATHALLRQSVVMRPAAARASPASASDPLFTLAPAELVEVEEHHDDFVLVTDATGRQGWTTRSDLTPVLPRETGQ